MDLTANSYFIWDFDLTRDLLFLYSSLVADTTDFLMLLPFNFLSYEPDSLILEIAGFKQTGSSTNVFWSLL
jgi:hypothetical protein